MRDEKSTPVHPSIAQLLRIRGHGRIEVCGGIGTGKSTLAAILAEVWQLTLVRERYEANPFWSKYHAEPEEYELEKNVSFLLAHGDAIRTSIRSARDGRTALLDFALFQDLAYADLSSRRQDAEVVELLYERLMDRFGPPSLLLFVRCPIDVQIGRIRKRGRAPEADLGDPFLSALADAIEARLDRMRVKLPVVEIDSGQLDFLRKPALAVATVEALVRERLVSIAAT